MNGCESQPNGRNFLFLFYLFCLFFFFFFLCPPILLLRSLPSLLFVSLHYLFSLYLSTSKMSYFGVFRRSAVLYSAIPKKASTNIPGLQVVPNAREVLTFLYKKTLDELKIDSMLSHILLSVCPLPFPSSFIHSFLFFLQQMSDFIIFILSMFECPLLLFMYMLCRSTFRRIAAESLEKKR